MIPDVQTQRESDGAIPLADFKTFLDGKIKAWNNQLGFANDIVGHCQQAYTTAITDDLGDGVDSFRTDLYNSCGVPQPSF